MPDCSSCRPRWKRWIGCGTRRHKPSAMGHLFATRCGKLKRHPRLPTERDARSPAGLKALNLDLEPAPTGGPAVEEVISLPECKLMPRGHRRRTRNVMPGLTRIAGHGCLMQTCRRRTRTTCGGVLVTRHQAAQSMKAMRPRAGTIYWPSFWPKPDAGLLRCSTGPPGPEILDGTQFPARRNRERQTTVPVLQLGLPPTSVTRAPQPPNRAGYLPETARLLLPVSAAWNPETSGPKLYYRTWSSRSTIMHSARFLLLT